MSELGLMLFSSVPVWHNEYNDHLTPIRPKRTSHQAANIRCFDQKIQPGPSFQGCAKVVAPAGTLLIDAKGALGKLRFATRANVHVTNRGCRAYLADLAEREGAR